LGAAAKARDLDELNLHSCRSLAANMNGAGHDTTVGAATIAERTHLLPLAEQNFEPANLAVSGARGWLGIDCRDAGE
jgi:hypothetical protein